MAGCSKKSVFCNVWVFRDSELLPISPVAPGDTLPEFAIWNCSGYNWNASGKYADKTSDVVVVTCAPSGPICFWQEMSDECISDVSCVPIEIPFVSRAGGCWVQLTLFLWLVLILTLLCSCGRADNDGKSLRTSEGGTVSEAPPAIPSSAPFVSRRQSFDAFQHLFRKISLPFHFNGTFIGKEGDTYGRTEIDSGLVRTFIVDRFDSVVSAEDLDSYRCYPAVMFRIGDSCICVVYTMTCSAGGQCEKFVLQAFRPDGEWVSRIMIAACYADAGFERLITSKVGKSGSIEVEERETMMNSATDEVESRKLFVVGSYQLLPSGQIARVGIEHH